MFCLECETTFRVTIEVEHLIERWKNYAVTKNLSKTVLKAGIRKRTPKGHLKTKKAYLLHLFKDH